MKTEEEIQAEFKANLVVPAEKPPVQFAVCPVGLNGSGKTRVIKPIAEALNLVRISSDEYRVPLRENGYGYESLKPFLAKTVQTLLNEGHSIALDMNCAGELTHKMIRHEEAVRNIKIFWIHLNTPEDYAHEGLLKRRSLLVEKPEDWIENRAGQKKSRDELGLKFDFFYEFDISKPTLEVDIIDCAEKIKAELGQ